MDGLPIRKNTCLKDYDYSQAGCYFITVCVKDMKQILCQIDVGARIARPTLSETGIIIETAIKNIPKIYPDVFIDNYVIMPNHIHLIITIEKNNGRAMRAPTISRIINQLKGYVTKQLGLSIWQKLFYDHIIRNEKDYLRIWQYIDKNPIKWREDRYYVNGEE